MSPARVLDVVEAHRRRPCAQTLVGVLLCLRTAEIPRAKIWDDYHEPLDYYIKEIGPQPELVVWLPETIT